ncbi:hypothetical protein P167DRAFT_181952 [Morchella conica CCBAS932]|uniref:Uncharacterized protein n=1 Tax=Morchella conica CCBAS932 TaxID=1392247 RepID=A0A3N4KMX2_9PEZI|nr:hypothetical protein P167DRAFT_181952 [Morchella conica CCBAS932]
MQWREERAEGEGWERKGRNRACALLCLPFRPCYLHTYTHNLQVKLPVARRQADRQAGRLAGWLMLFQGCGQVPMATIKGTGVDSSLIWFGAVRLESVWCCCTYCTYLLILLPRVPRVPTVGTWCLLRRHAHGQCRGQANDYFY